MTTNAKVIRPLSTIASEIKKDWRATAKDGKIYFGAVPYLDAMSTLDKITDRFICEDARTQVIYFLSNATTWRGDKAREIKKELNAMLKSK